MERPLRIGLVSSWPTDPTRGSGTAVAVEGLVRGLEALGHRVLRAVPVGGGSTGLLPRLTFNVRLGLNPPDRLDALDALVGVDADGLLLRIRLGRGLPYIVLLKGIATDEARFERGGAAAKLRLLGRLEAVNAQWADRVVVPSRYSRDEAIRRYGLAPSRVVVVPEAVVGGWNEHLGSSRPDSGPVAAWRRPAARPTVLTVGRQYARKRTDVLIRAVEILARRLPDVEVVVVGGGPELPRLRRLARRLGVMSSVRFMGATDRSTLREAYRRAWCFCLPSEQEAFGIVLVEAMQAGLPVVASRAAAVPEVVDHGRTGLLVEPGRPDALAEALEDVLRDPVKRRRMGAAGRIRARRYGADRHARAFLDAIRPVLRRPGPAGPPGTGASGRLRKLQGRLDRGRCGANDPGRSTAVAGDTASPGAK